MSRDARARALGALSRFMVAEASMRDTLMRVTEIAAETISATAMAGVAVMGDDGKPTTAVFTDDKAPQIDLGQYESGNGPCLEAWRTRRVVRIEEMTAATDRYPEFSAMALAHGIHSTLSLPLVAGDNGVGALNLYAHTEHGFTADDEVIGLELASTAAVVLANAGAYWGVSELAQQLQQAMESRAEIEQAKGMLMARSAGLSADEAFDLLRRASQRENVKLREIARRIVQRQATLPPDC